MSTNLSAKNNAYVEMMGDIFRVSSAIGVRSFAWGGFAVDVLCGVLTREHGDLDMFTENLTEHLDALRTAYEALGYRTAYLENFWMLQLRKGEVHAAFNEVKIIDGIAHWRHIGPHGTVFFPCEWLDEQPREFYDAQVFTAGAGLLYAIKTNPQLLSPEWKAREKDRADIAALESLLQTQGVHPADVLSQVWSHNPFWYAKGYAEYLLPVFARQLG